MKLILIFGMAFILLEAKKTDPGVVGRLTLKGLEYGWKVGLEELQKQLPTIHIPDVEGYKVTLIGHVNYYVTDLKIENLDFSNSSLTYSPDTGVNVSIRQGQFQIVGQMRIHCSLFSGSSRMTLSVRGFSVAGSVGITCDDLGHGAVWDAGCHSDVDRVDLSFSGGHHKWILNMLKGAMKGPIRSAIRSQICPSFEKAVQQMEKTLSTLPVSIAVDSVSEVEVDLVGPPLITSERFDLLVKGDFVAQSQSLTPYQPEKLVLPDVDSRMLLVALSQFSANSAGFVHYKAGFLKYNVTDDMIPTMSPIRLNINGLGIFAPELPSRYPDSPPLMLQVSARSAPTVTCLLDSLTVQASMDFEVFAMYSGQPSISLFQIQADSLTGVDIVLSEETVGATISVKNFSLSLVRSSVGTVKVDAIQKTLNVALKLLLPLLNGRIKNIIPLPMNMPRLQNPVVRVMQGYVLIMTDLEATLSSLDFSKLFGFEELQTSVAE